ncbi:GyrI-like domain-containing protein [Paenibacillus sp. NPDC057934]|uniref:GyrI-like domain-containing protein n=1 Tax=Paenibacillus sp. NPDC057934 TaxID=3346282 RepID=UPI0036D924F3
MKYEWKKQDKSLYLPQAKPELVTVPGFNYFMLEGLGNPNSDLFSETVGVLYSLAYAAKMLPKKGKLPAEGYYDYSVFPLEGVWDLTEEGKQKDVLDKDELLYTLMIRQPEFVTADLAAEILETVKLTKPHVLMEKALFGKVEEGLSVQMLHYGSYDDEPESFAVMEDYCIQNGLKRASKTHREIYLTDARRTRPDKLKTVLRFKVKRTE